MVKRASVKLFQRIQVQYPASLSDGSQPLVTLMPEHTAPFLTLQLPEVMYTLTYKQTDRPLVLALRRLRQEDFNFKMSLRHIGRFCLK